MKEIWLPLHVVFFCMNSTCRYQVWCGGCFIILTILSNIVHYRIKGFTEPPRLVYGSMPWFHDYLFECDLHISRWIREFLYDRSSCLSFLQEMLIVVMIITWCLFWREPEEETVPEKVWWESGAWSTWKEKSIIFNPRWIGPLRPLPSRSGSVPSSLG